jgi:hypothetical protein
MQATPAQGRLAMTGSQRAASPVAPAQPRPVLYLAAVGALLIAFELSVLGRWVTGPNFKATPTGVDGSSSTAEFFYVVLQAGCCLLFVACMWLWVIRPYRREGRLTTDAMFALAAAMLFFWDMSMNYTSITLFYNSNFVNFGAWANGAWPGWTAPNGNLLPEPILFVPPAYTCLVFVQVMLVLWVVRKLEARRPGMGFLATVATIVGGLFLTDTIIEGSVLRTGLYAYPGGIHELTLFAGRTYQVPLTETFFFGGLGLGAIAMLMHVRDDKGRTIVERGLDRVAVTTRKRQLIKFCAIFGAVHGSFLVLYTAPSQWLATHSDPFPRGYPSYLENGMCASGADGKTCPGPGAPMPRPSTNPF